MTANTLPSGSADRRLVVTAGAVIAISVIAVIVRALGLMPSALATGIVLGAVLIGLRVLMIFSARAAGSAARARVLTNVANVGLAISAVTIVAALPHLTSSGGAGTFFGDLAAHLWPLMLLLLAAGGVRTVGWRVLVGIGFAGFLGISSLARFVGTPVVSHLGSNNLFATAIYVPVTEELLKALPVLAVVFFAVRRRASRPAALDAALLGAVIGLGFAVYENALYGRGGAAWSANAPFSILFPTELKARIGSTSYIAGGHLVYTALIALGLGITAYYHRRFRWAALAAPIAAVDVLAEHICANAVGLVDAKGHEPLIERILSPLTIGGRLSSLLLICGVVATAWFERRIAGRTPVRAWLVLPEAEAARRAQALAAGQAGRPASSAVPLPTRRSAPPQTQGSPPSPTSSRPTSTGASQ